MKQSEWKSEENKNFAQLTKKSIKRLYDQNLYIGSPYYYEDNKLKMGVCDFTTKMATHGEKPIISG